MTWDRPVAPAATQALVGLALLVSIAGCGSAQPAAVTPPTRPAATTTLPPEPCGRPAPSTSAAVAIPAAAALLAATVVVDAHTADPPLCEPLETGHTIHLHLGDRAEFVANQVPQLTPPGSGAVRITTRPGPSEVFAGLVTHHLVISLTAVQPGTVSVRWIDCSGTGC